jgi:hypothetical protein
MKMLNLSMDNDVCIIMPNAPYVDNKRSWYPLPTSNSAGTIKEDHDGLRKSKNSINQFIKSFKLREEQKNYSWWFFTRCCFIAEHVI